MKNNPIIFYDIQKEFDAIVSTDLMDVFPNKTFFQYTSNVQCFTYYKENIYKNENLEKIWLRFVDSFKKVIEKKREVLLSENKTIYLVLLEDYFIDAQSYMCCKFNTCFEDVPDNINIKRYYLDFAINDKFINIYYMVEYVDSRSQTLAILTVFFQSFF